LLRTAPAGPSGNGARFAAIPLTAGGTPAGAWLSADPLPPLDLGECAALVVVAPHPDDETLGLGATAAQLVSSGVDVQVVSVSDGGAADPDAPTSDRIRLETTRRSELLRATDVLGVHESVSLGLPDGQLTDHEDRLTELLAAILAGAAPAHLVRGHLARRRAPRPRGRRTRGGRGVRPRRCRVAGVSGVDVALGHPVRSRGALGPGAPGAAVPIGAGP